MNSWSISKLIDFDNSKLFCLEDAAIYINHSHTDENILKKFIFDLKSLLERNYGLKLKVYERENIYKGQIINKLKKNYFINELMITCPYDPNLKAGETIKLNIFLSGEGKNPVRSKRLSGKYIIEASEQIWSAQLKKAFSKLLIGVPSSGTDPNIPSDYRYKELLV